MLVEGIDGNVDKDADMSCMIGLASVFLLPGSELNSQANKALNVILSGSFIHKPPHDARTWYGA